MNKRLVARELSKIAKLLVAESRNVQLVRLDLGKEIGPTGPNAVDKVDELEAFVMIPDGMEKRDIPPTLTVRKMTKETGTGPRKINVTMPKKTPLNPTK